MFQPEKDYLVYKVYENRIQRLLLMMMMKKISMNNLKRFPDQNKILLRDLWTLKNVKTLCS